MSTHGPYIETEPPFEIADQDDSVTLQKLITPRGERLEISTPELGTSIAVDALDLESLTFQDEETLRAIGNPARDPLGTDEQLSGNDITEEPTAGAASAESTSARVSNEFTQVTVSKIETTNGDRLDITSEKLGYSNRLTPSVLRAISGQGPDMFSEFLHEPWGPDHDHH